MGTTTYLLTVFHFGAFRHHNQGPLVNEGYQLAVLCQAEPVLDGFEPGTPIELRLAGEPVGEGLPCVFLSYAADLWNRPVGKTFRSPLEWPLAEPIPVVRPFISISVPPLPRRQLVQEWVEFAECNESGSVTRGLRRNPFR